MYSKNTNTMTYYSTLFSRYGVDDAVLENRTQKRAVGSVLEQIDRKKVNPNEKLDKARAKSLRRAFGKAKWFKKVAASLTFATALTLFQAPPVQASTTSIVKELSNYSSSLIDEDSSIKVEKEDLKEQELQTTSLHFVTDKKLFNSYESLQENSVILDDDSDVAFTPREVTQHLTVIDTTVEDWQTLAKAVDKGSILLLQKDDNALEEILATLKHLKTVESLNIISHGSSGQLHFSDKTISQESLELNKEKWQELGSYLDRDGDINLFGCNVAEGEKGTEFIETLASFTQADVAASLNPTGNSDKDSDWKLESVVGSVHKSTVLNYTQLKDFTNILAAFTGTISNSGSYAEVYISGNAKITMTDYILYGDGNIDYVNYGSSYSAVFMVGTGVSSVDINFKKVGTLEATTFDINSLIIGGNGNGCARGGSSVSVVVKSDKGDTSAAQVIDTAVWTSTSKKTFDLSGFSSGVSTLTIEASNGSSTIGCMVIDELDVANLQVPPSADATSTLTSSATLTEPSSIATTATGTGNDVSLLDFTIEDPAAGDDGNPTIISQIQVDVTGTATDAELALMKFLLNGNDVTDLEGTYDSGTDKITFDLSSSNISVADDASETYTISAYFNDNTSSNDITEGHTIILAVNASDLTTTGTTSTFAGSQSDVNNGSGAAIAVTATTLEFSTQPAGSVSGSALTTQPVVQAVDARGNIDTGFTETITLTQGSAGSLSGDIDITAVSGVATFTDVAYTATADQQSFTLTANDEDGTDTDLSTVDANAVTSDVVATKLLFTTQPSPLSAANATENDLSTDPIVKAVDANDVVDTGYNTAIVLAENGAGTAAMTGTGDTDGDGATVTLTPSSGVATFTGLAVTYTAAGGTAENYTLRATSGGLTFADSSQFTATFDTTAPTISAISIPAATMTVGDTVTATITVTSDSDDYTTGSGAITGTIGGFTLGTLSKTNDTTYTAQFTVTEGGSDVAAGSDIPVSVKLTDSSGNQMATAFTTAISQGSDPIDANTPTLSSVTMTSNNSDTAKAKTGDVVTVTFTASEALTGTPTVTIDGNAASVTNTSGNTYTATRTMQSGDTEGSLAFTIDFTDSAGNAGTRVTAVTSGSAVTFDETAPNGYSVNFTTDPINNSNKTAAAFQFASAEVGATYNYSIDDTNGATAAVTGTATVTGATQTISNIDVSSLDDDTLTLTVTLTDPTGNVGTDATDTVTKDVVAPTLSEVTAVTAITTDSTPDFTFSSSEGGTLAVGGSCGSGDEGAIGSGNNTITLTQGDNSTALADGTYSDCTVTVTDAAGNVSSALTLSSFKVDTTAPSNATFNPLNGSNSHSIGNNMTITFDEAVRNTDDSEITDANVDSLITLKLTDSSGSDVGFDATIDANKEIITINPTNNLTEGQIYYLAYSDVEDTAGLARAGESIIFIAAPDTDAPTISSFSPADDSTTVHIDSNLVATFNENIQAISGNIVLKKSDGTVVETIDVTDNTKVTISGAALTINPTNNLEFNTGYYVEIDATAIDDVATTPNSFAGITGNTTWNFTTYANVSLSNLEAAAISYTEGDGNVSITSLVEVTSASNENIESAKVGITGNLVSSEDNLHFVDTVNITGSYSSTTGILTLSGTDSVTNYQAALRSIVYENNNTGNPTVTARTFDMNVTDTKGSSSNVSRTISLLETNDLPSIGLISDSSQATDYSENNITVTEDFTTFDITLSSIVDLDREDLNITVESNITGLVTITQNWDNNLSYASYNNQDLTFSVAAVTDAIGLVELNVTVEDNETKVGNLIYIEVEEEEYIPPYIPPVVEEEEEVVEEEEEPTDESEEPTTPTDPETPTDSTEPEDTTEPEIPIIEDIIADDGDFDEDPTDSDIDVVVIGTDGEENTETINTLETGKEVVVREEEGVEEGTKEFKLEFTDTETSETSEKSIVIKNSEATTITTDTGYEIKSELDDEEKSVTTKIELNTNGTSVSSLVTTDKETGEKKKAAISSFKSDVDTEVSEDGEITISSSEASTENENEVVEAKAVIHSDGSVEHSVVIKDENGNEVESTKAMSKANNTVTSILEDGSVQTKATVLNESNEKVIVSVNGDKEGKASHILKVTTSSGEEVITKAESEIAGATTTIEEDGTVETSVVTESNVELKVQANSDGSATHQVAIPKEDGTVVSSKATSKIPGAKTTVTSEGKVVTEAKVIKADGNGAQFEITAVAETNEDGTTHTRFERVNLTTGETEELDRTISEATPFEEGNEVEVEDLGSDLQIKVKSKVTRTIIIE